MGVKKSHFLIEMIELYYLSLYDGRRESSNINEAKDDNVRDKINKCNRRNCKRAC